MMIIIFMKCLYLFNLQFLVLYEILMKNLYLFVKFLFIMKLFVIQFFYILCFVCRWIYRVFYLYYVLFVVIIFFVIGIVVIFILNYFIGQFLKRSCFFQFGKKFGISNWYFFFVDMNMFDDFDKKFVYRWVDCVFCYLLFGC